MKSSSIRESSIRAEPFALAAKHTFGLTAGMIELPIRLTPELGRFATSNRCSTQYLVPFNHLAIGLGLNCPQDGVRV